MRRWAVLIVGVWLSACANLDKFYTPEVAQPFPPTSTVAVVDGGQDAEATYDAMYRNANYRRIGHLNYVGESLDDDRIVALGRQVGADVAIVSKRYTGSRVVEQDRGGADGAAVGASAQYGLNPSSGAEPGFSPNAIQPQLPRSYVVREFRVVAIFLRRVTPG